MIVYGIGASHVWRKMVQIRDVVGHNIWWQLKSRKSNFWFDNWTKLGALYFIEPHNSSKVEVEIKDFILGGAWDRQRLGTYLTDPRVVDFICESIKPPNIEDVQDKAW